MTITQRNLDGYGTPPIEWARVQAVLDTRLTQAPGTGGPRRHTAWLTTINPDGSPHVMSVGVVRRGGSWYFTSGPATRKTRNLARRACRLRADGGIQRSVCRPGAVACLSRAAVDRVRVRHGGTFRRHEISVGLSSFGVRAEIRLRHRARIM